MVRLQDLHLVAVPANSLTELLASPRAGAAPGVNGEYQKGSSETAPAPLPTGAPTTGPLEPTALRCQPGLRLRCSDTTSGDLNGYRHWGGITKHVASPPDRLNVLLAPGYLTSFFRSLQI